MLITENNTYKIGATVVAAFGYEGLKTRKIFIKESLTQYRLFNSSKIISYCSLTTLSGALKSESI